MPKGLRQQKDLQSELVVFGKKLVVLTRGFHREANHFHTTFYW